MRHLTLILGCTFVVSLQAQQLKPSEIDWSKADSIAKEHQGASLRNIPLLAHKLTTGLSTDHERFRAIYYWVTHNIEGDYQLVDINDRKRRKLKDNPAALNTWNTQFKLKVFSTLTTQKKTLCSGYAYLIQALAKWANIESVAINGYGKAGKTITSKASSLNHSWNAVKLGNQWYLCDATWASGYTDMDTLTFIFDYDDRYFLMNPEKFLKSHQPLDPKWTLIGDPPQGILALNP